MDVTDKAVANPISNPADVPSQHPVLLVHGERDNAIPLSSVREAQAKLPDAEVVVVDGLGHLAHEERPAEAVDLIVSFAIAHGILPTGKQAGD